MIWEGLMLVKETEQLGPNKKHLNCANACYVHMLIEHCTALVF